MNPGIRLTLVLAGAGFAAALGAWTVARLQRRRRKTPEEIERLRRLEVNRRGRITAGQIVDLVVPEPPASAAHLVLYKYEVGGVTYEAAQDVSALPDALARTQGLAGQTASIKYDPKKPTNSIIACEAWCGIKDIESLSH